MNKLKLITTVSTVLLLSACGAGERIANIGKAPDLSPIDNPAETGAYTRVAMPMPAVQPDIRQNNSLWGGNKQTFFKDQRASDVGDILTVMIEIDDEAELENETERSRSASEGVGLNTADMDEAVESGVFEDLIDQHRADAAKAGVFGVPTFVVDGQLIWGRQTMDEVEEAIRQAGVPRKGRRG